MSIVTPIPQESTVTLYKGIPWDSRNENVRLFKTEQERHGFFNGKAVQQWLNCSIVKKGKSIRLEGDWRRYLNCNYMSFTNGDIGARPTVFYCFVTSIEYVNVNAFEIVYEIDWIQTYILDIVFEPCFVEREHVSNDSFGLHTVDEGLDGGEYCIEEQINHVKQPAWMSTVMGDSITPEIIDNVVTVLGSYVGENNESGMTFLSDLLYAFNSAPERVVIITMAVADMRGANGVPTAFHGSFNVVMNGASFNFGNSSYIPKNNKMLTYPYKFFTIDNFSGELEQFHWEDFTDNDTGLKECSFAFEGNPLPQPCMECFPINFKGYNQTGGGKVNTQQQFSVRFTDFPQVAWASDTFRAWVSQYGYTKTVQQASNVVLSIAGMAASIGTGNIPGALASGVSMINQSNEYMQEVKNYQIHSRQLHGTVASSGMAFERGTVGFRETQYCIRPEQAERIDRFFTRYGYRVSTIKIPNTQGREYCNYVKTKCSHVAGDIAVDAKEAMERALDNGVTFWHTNDVGMTLESNPIVGG